MAEEPNPTTSAPVAGPWRACVRAACWVGWLLWPLLGAEQAPAGQPVTLHYVQRPPYMVAQGEGLIGLTGGPSYQAFKLAQVPVRVEETPCAGADELGLLG